MPKGIYNRRSTLDNIREQDAMREKQEIVHGLAAQAADTLNKPSNQIDHLKDAIEHRDRVILEQQAELLELYRRLYAHDSPTRPDLDY